ncbi:MAG: VWA domain-containing protein [Methanofollis sp.]|uniref:vWA domain-containing protein n=1 Tax=Methanofollis sp. TaxID=2052835 RepID=UPI0026243B78|nr:VWA domain-containing protein [Methanofollis sp.]MDD4253953.1 VWA domain-containing protein [Methanofollis sp.]
MDEHLISGMGSPYELNRLSQIVKGDLNPIISVPRTIPRRVREDIAEIYVSELILGDHYEIRDARRFIERFGVFYPIYLNLKWNSAWSDLRKLAEKSPVAGIQALKVFLKKTFDIIDCFSQHSLHLKDSHDPSLQEALNELFRLLEQTQRIWEDPEPEGDHDLPQDAETDPDLAPQFEDLSGDLKVLQSTSDPQVLHNFLNDAFQAGQELENFIRAESAKAQSPGEGADINILSYYAEQFAQEYSRLLETTSDGEGQSPSDDDGNEENAEEKLSGPIQDAGNDGASSSISSARESGQMQLSDNDIPIFSPSEELQRDILDDLDNIISGIILALKSDSKDASDSDNPQEGLVGGVLKFTEKPESNEIIQAILRHQLNPAMDPVLSTLQKNLDVLEILVQLFPGRQWDYSLKDLHRNYLENLERYAKIAEDSKTLKEIVEQLGRIEMEYGSRKIAVSSHGKTEMHSITYSSDLDHLLPTEAVKLQNPTLKLKFAADLAEKKLLTYQLRGKNWVGGPPSARKRGPVVALVDTSKSMRGSPETIAKATILAIARRMLKEERDVKVILFSSRNQLDTIDLTGTKRMAREFLEFLNQTFGGGTDFNTALKAGMRSLKEPQFRSADLLFITDGGSKISNEALLDEWNSLKKEQDARIFSMIIGRTTAGGLEQVSDETYLMQKSDAWSPGNSPAHLIRHITMRSW